MTPTETTLQICPTKGRAQGNVLSPMLWNNIVNRVGDIIDNLNIGGCLFSDDIVVAVQGDDISRTCDTIQNALNQLSKWANEEGLKI
jgi:hypothetical protein